MEQRNMADDQATTEELDQDALDAQAEADFEAGFKNVRGGAQEPPEKRPESELEASAEGEEEQAAEETPTEEPEVPVLAGYTETQLKALLERAGKIDQLEQAQTAATSKIFGKFGEINRALQEISKRGSDATPTQQRAAQVTADKLKRLGAEYPDIARMLAEDLSELGESNQSLTPEMLDEAINKRLSESVGVRDSEVDQRVEKRLLKLRHRDWQDVAKSDAFNAWTATLPAEEQQALSETWDADFIADKLDEFKAHQAEANKPQPTKPPANKQNRLRSNVRPQSAAKTERAPLSDEELFEFGFKKARGGG